MISKAMLLRMVTSFPDDVVFSHLNYNAVDGLMYRIAEPPMTALSSPRHLKKTLDDYVPAFQWKTTDLEVEDMLDAWPRYDDDVLAVCHDLLDARSELERIERLALEVD